MDEATALKMSQPDAEGRERRRAVRPDESREIDPESLVAAHGRSITRLVWRLVGRREDVEDLVQETFLAALRSRGSFCGKCEVATWLARIALNKCRSYHRWRRVRRFVRLMPGDTLDRPARTGTSETTETEEEVRLAVRRLPTKYREVIVLRYFEDLSIGEMVDVLGSSRTAIEKRLSRARQRLKEMLIARS